VSEKAAPLLLQNDPEATKPYPSRRPSAIRPDTGQPTAQPWGKHEQKSNSALPTARNGAEPGTCLNKHSVTALPPFTPFLCVSKILGFALFALIRG